ncbi:MAG: DUF397 domain-containing protein [Pseudonocardia sp.]
MQAQLRRKNSFSLNGGSERIEVTVLPNGQVELRDSKHPEATHFTFTRAEITAWIKGIKAGEFDDLC